uniref:Fatty acid hydroxylase domain-containing protein n=1 Tax=Pseudictyota dubia TaxID=2749911 RepID=A0A7R9W3T3_9STRA|mmetsp:Transcript_30093/g.55919  ORF Transcript_30093/g.55919 Transcript_30093/m.55919 type:complete len:452 (+) Transcript_30093:126-1481(+)|eukprot:CAMPEP_0197468738 /NCGR_PEP_ID=MMETSP1175-20131217/66240_1 /TAXON_ID=1003142 /ORGANISM="Triceratium dubium, Strain CCMP147" /LENGTH=451 /DNA_ID=CAMNT_0043004855 /DNA_START=114 /DNA_END=1469 /DNA_ORIENTATION=-
MIRTIRSSLTALTTGNIVLFCFYLSHLFEPYFRLPKELYDDACLAKRMGKKEEFALVVDKSFVDGYNRDIDDMKEYIKRLWGASAHVDYRVKQTLFWIVRFATIAAAFYTSNNYQDKALHQVLLVSLLQFAILPYSLSVALGYGLETVFVLYTGHALVMPILTASTSVLVPEPYNIAVMISPTFLATFLILDQLLCVYTLFKTPVGPVEKLPAKRIWQSVWYGFLNCKTYYLILLPLSYGTKIAIIPWLVDYFLGLSNLITKRTMTYWTVLFYHAHRVGHIPIVYPDAHRFHHHLHDSTSFDAHIFGSGAPEEWLILVSDICIARFLKIMPASLGPSVLAVSWYNKWGFHARKANPDDDGDNFHVNHHSLHVKNLGITYPYDLLMGTAMKSKVTWAGYEIFREETKDGKSYKLCFVPLANDENGQFKKLKRQSLSMSGVDFSGLDEGYLSQ